MSRDELPNADLFSRIHEFVVAGADDELTPEQWESFERLLHESDDACRLYLEYVEASDLLPSILDAVVQEETPAQPFVVSDIAPAIRQPLNLFSSATTGGTGFFSGWPAAYLIATVIFGVGALIGAFTYVSQPAINEGQSPSFAHHSPDSAAIQNAVGRITGAADCRWEREGLGIRDLGLEEDTRFKVQGSRFNNFQSPTSKSRNPQIPKSLVCLGDQFVLSAGLMEITYNTGARVILQGPCTYQVDSADGGFLSVGKLTARIGEREDTRFKVQGSRFKAGKSPNSNPQSLIPNPLFTVRTPTATITDLGTEFGVEVDQTGNTTSHVFQGVVQVRTIATDGKTLSDIRVLHENESARVERKSDGAAATVSLHASSPSDVHPFVRELPKPRIKILDLADMVAGGDGFSGRRNRGIDPTNGLPIDVTIKEHDGEGYPMMTSDRRYHPVETLPLVDGVFIPDGRSGAVQVDSAGHVFDGFAETQGMTPVHIWSGGTVPVPTSSMPPHVSAMLQSLSPTTSLGPTQLGGVDYAKPGHGLIFMHANNGITFDLEAMRRANPGCKLLRFRAMAGNVEPVSSRGLEAGYADVWVLVDGQVRFRRREINGCSGAFPIQFSIAESDRFLTLVASDGGNTMAGDWVLFGDPVLEMAAEKQQGGQK